MTARCLLLLPSLLAGCGGEFSNELFGEDERFLTAVPSAAELSLSAPTPGVEEGETGTLRQGLAPPRAELYTITRRITLDIDRSVGHHLRDVGRLVAEPPAERTPTRREWGPFTHPLDPLEARFVMEETDPGVFAYALEKRRKGAGDFTATITGSFEAAGGARQGDGSITFHLDADARLTGSPSGGLVLMDYHLEAAEARIAVRLADFVEDPEQPALEAAYDYRRHPGGGEFEFVYAPQDGERVEAKTRWRPDGAGRADGRWFSVVEVVFSECWDTAFSRTYYEATPEVAPKEGDPASCAFEARELPGA